MNSIWIIAKRELNAYFDSLIAYFMLVLFLGFSGFFTWLYGNDIFLINQATLRGFFGIAYWTLFFFIPAITMRLIAEEKKTGTIELLLTKAISDRQVIVGKFLSAVLLIGIALLCTLPYVITVSSLGNIDNGEVINGYLGLMLVSATYISIGIWASSITSNQIVAFLLALVIGAVFHIIFGVLSGVFTGFVGEIFGMLSLSTHFEGLQRGVIDSKDILYFLSIIFLALYLAENSLAKRKIAG